MTTNISVKDYWPFWVVPKLVRFDYTDPSKVAPPHTSVFSYDTGTGSMLLNEYDVKLTWLDRWYYNYQPGFGVPEWRDDYPGRKVVLSPAIGWGDQETIGGSYVNYPRMSLLQSWPPALASGVQTVAYEALLPSFANSKGEYGETLVFSYLQSWDGKPATGARYWMVQGLGPVSLEWLAQDPKNLTGPIATSNRMDATVTKVLL